MLTNTCTLEQSAGRLNILVHGRNGTVIEVRDSYIGVAAGEIPGVVFEHMLDGSDVWRIDGKLARVACLRADRYDPDAMPLAGPPGAFVTYTDWPRIESIVAEMRRDWGDLPVQVNAA